MSIVSTLIWSFLPFSTWGTGRCANQSFVVFLLDHIEKPRFRHQWWRCPKNLVQFQYSILQYISSLEIVNSIFLWHGQRAEFYNNYHSVTSTTWGVLRSVLPQRLEYPPSTPSGSISLRLVGAARDLQLHYFWNALCTIRLRISGSKGTLHSSPYFLPLVLYIGHIISFKAIRLECCAAWI